MHKVHNVSMLRSSRVHASDDCRFILRLPHWQLFLNWVSAQVTQNPTKTPKY